jgi:hypothetical protein
MTEEDEGEPRRQSYEQLKRLLAIQATLLQRAELTADLLRWKCLDAGIAIDHTPGIAHPVTGAIPPGAELVIRDREQEERDMEDDEIIKVPDPSDMAAGDFLRHCLLRHHVAMDKERHDLQHTAGLAPEHAHKPGAWARAQAARADIRFGHPSIEPVESETIGEGEE